MKNPRNFRSTIAFFCTIAIFIACQEEDQIARDTDNIVTEQGPGLDGLSLDTMNEQEVTRFLEETEISKKKLSATRKEQISFDEIEVSYTKGRSKEITDLYCGLTNSGTTINEGNTVNFYSGNDKVYEFSIEKEDEVDISMNKLNSDLDLFLTTVVVDSYGRKLIGTTLAKSINGDSNPEEIKIKLSKGSYFIVVETYDFPGDFEIVLSCKNGGKFYHCENFENLEASLDYRNNGIAEQSHNLWYIWNSYKNDGAVLFEDYKYKNKVVKLDASRFRDQDIVRTLIGLPLSNGLYTMTFDMYIPYGRKASFATEKNQKFGTYYGEQGFEIELQNRELTITYRDHKYQFSCDYKENDWNAVDIIFNMINKEVYVLIGNLWIIMDSRSKRYDEKLGVNSIYGVNFYNDSYYSRFHLDNVCVKELIPGYDDPLKPYIINAYNVINLKEEN